MSRWLILPVLLCLVGGPLSAQTPPPPKKTYPEVGSDIPGPFKPYNVTDPRMKGYAKRYHCLVSEHGLNPTVAVFVRGTELSDPLKKLLLDLDEIVAKNPRARLAAFAIFVDDKMTNPVTEDDKRRATEMQVEGIHQATQLKHTALALDSAKNVEKYKLADDALVTVLLYKDYRVVGLFKIKADELEKKGPDVITAVRKAFIPEN